MYRLRNTVRFVVVLALFWGPFAAKGTVPKDARGGNRHPMVVVDGFLRSIGGRSHCARFYANGLHNIGVPVAAHVVGIARPELPKLVDRQLLNRIDKWEAARLRMPYVRLHYKDTDKFKRDPKAARNIGYSVYETNLAPASWVPHLKKMDEVWTASTFVREAYVRSGVPADKVFVVPHGVDTAVYNTSQRQPRSAAGEVRFIASFGWEPRKNAEAMLRAYFKAFPHGEKVSLTARTLARLENPEAFADFEALRDRLARESGITNPPRVVLDTRKIITDLEMAKFMCSGDAYVSATRGEGFGLTSFEAMACGVPPIITGFGGQTDYVTKRNGWLIDYTLGPVPKQDMEYGAYFPLLGEPPQEQRRHRRAEVNEAHLVKVLRSVYKNPERAAQKGKQAAKDIAKWTWERAATRMLDRVHKLMGS